MEISNELYQRMLQASVPETPITHFNAYFAEKVTDEVSRRAKNAIEAHESYFVCGEADGIKFYPVRKKPEFFKYINLKLSGKVALIRNGEVHEITRNNFKQWREKIYGRYMYGDTPISAQEVERISEDNKREDLFNSCQGHAMRKRKRMGYKWSEIGSREQMEQCSNQIARDMGIIFTIVPE